MIAVNPKLSTLWKNISCSCVNVMNRNHLNLYHLFQITSAMLQWLVLEAKKVFVFLPCEKIDFKGNPANKKRFEILILFILWEFVFMGSPNILSSQCYWLTHIPKKTIALDCSVIQTLCGNECCHLLKVINSDFFHSQVVTQHSCPTTLRLTIFACKLQ